MINRKFFGVLAAVGLLPVISGCPATEAEFNNFIDNYQSINASSSGSGGGGGAQACAAVPAAGEADGDFLFALSAKLNPKKPVLFDTDLTTQDGPNGLQFSLLLQPLDAKDRTSPVGASTTVGPFDVNADGSFTAVFPPLSVDGAANGLTGSDLVAEATIIGQLCAPADFICGDITGWVTSPSMLPLDGSTFTMERLSAPGTFPEPPKINCAKDEAAAL